VDPPPDRPDGWWTTVTGSRSVAHEAAFYCASSELYFPGAVAMINSLRLQGHREPIYVLDCGLEPAHRRLLSTEATVVPSPSDVPPHLLKTIAPMAHPARTMVLIDVDMVVTKPLGELIAKASAGHVVAFADNLDRFVPEWGELLGLGDLQRRTYVSSGFVAMGGEFGADVLRLWDERQSTLDYERSWFGRDDPTYAFQFIDQDVLNAVIAARADDQQLVALAAELAPHQPYRGVRLVDARALRCEYRDGTRPYVLHQYLKKPWIDPMYHGIYSKLLSRLWLGDDVAMSLPPQEIPLRMRSGPRALLERKRVDFSDLARWYARDVIPEWIAARRGAGRSDR
jgi:hypothetical protein